MQTDSDDEEHEQRRLLPEGPSSPLQPATTAQLRRSGSERPSRTSLSIDGTGSGSWGPRQWHRWRRYSAGLPQLPLGAHAWQQVAQLTVLFVTFLLLQLFKSRSRNCSPAYFVLFVTQAVLCACATAVFLWRAATQQKQEASSNGNQAQLSAPVLRRQSSVGQDEAPAWTGRRLAMAACVTLAGGSIAGLLGIGGGMVMGPLFASFNVHPLVGAATSGLMVLFSSSAATLSFAIADAINLQYAMTYGILNLFASLVGVLLIGRIIRRSGRASLIVIILAVIIGVGACLTAGFQGRQAVSDLIHKTNLSFSPFCAPT